MENFISSCVLKNENCYIFEAKDIDGNIIHSEDISYSKNPYTTGMDCADAYGFLYYGVININRQNSSLL
jgi:hypothetical protein